MSTTYTQLGDRVRIYGTTLLAGVPTDPTELTLTVTDPSATSTVYRYGVDPEVVRTDPGKFYFVLAANQGGSWTLRWEATGAFNSFDETVVDVADPVTVAVLYRPGGASPDVPIPHAEVEVLRPDGTKTTTTSDENGLAQFFLTDGSHEANGYLGGWRLARVVFNYSGPTPLTVTMLGAPESTYVSVRDLERIITPAEVDRLFDDTGRGVRQMPIVQALIRQAESVADSYMLRSWTREQIATLAANDDGFRLAVAWVAAELATERRGEFIAADGKGRYWAQYERSIQHFEMLSKSQMQSRGEAIAGTSANTGGAVRPQRATLPDPNNRWTFADSPSGRSKGGF